MLATSPSPWHHRHPKRTCAAMPSAWVGPTCPGTRSEPNTSRLTSESPSGSGSTFSYATATTSTAPTSSNTGRWSRRSAASGRMFSHALRRPVRRRGRARGVAAGAAVFLVPPSRRVQRFAAAVGQRIAPHSGAVSRPPTHLRFPGGCAWSPLGNERREPTRGSLQTRPRLIPPRRPGPCRAPRRATPGVTGCRRSRQLQLLRMARMAHTRGRSGRA